jgi:predicted acylesterase/phospholipase RssA
MEHRPHTIVLSGGGVRALAHIGALEVLEKNGILGRVRRWVGLSAGALVAFALTIGYTLRDLHDISTRIDLELLQDLEEGPFAFFDKLGLDTGCKLKKFLAALLSVRGLSPAITFQQLAEMKMPELVIYAADLQNGCSRCFSAASTPAAPVVDSLRASMSLPIYFQPIVDGETGHMLTDGAILGMYPRSLLEDSTVDGILGLLLVPRIDYTEAPTSIEEYVLRLFNIFCESRNREQYERFRDTTILIETASISPVDFKMTAEIRAALFQDGHAAALSYIRNKRTQPLRRHSL